MSPWAYKVSSEDLDYTPKLLLADEDASNFEDWDEDDISIISWDSADENGGDA